MDNILYKNDNCIIAYEKAGEYIRIYRKAKKIFGDSYYPAETVAMIDKKDLPKVKKELKKHGY